MMKVIALLVMVSFLLMSCAHVPQRAPVTTAPAPEVVFNEEADQGDEEWTEEEQKGESIGERSGAERAKDAEALREFGDMVKAAIVLTVILGLTIGAFFL